MFLTSAIVSFNDKIQELCNAIYVDSYSYLLSTGFDAPDGLHYSAGTYKDIYNYVLSCLAADLIIGFKQRTTVPAAESMFWVNTEYSIEGAQYGVNPYDIKSDNGSVLPSSTGYAWGRFSEIMDLPAKLPKANAEDWYNAAENLGYACGNEPQLGAIICWKQGVLNNAADGKGHIAVVEKIINDSSILVSESIDDSTTTLGKKFQTVEVKRETVNEIDYWIKADWEVANNYLFQGFIYNPSVLAGGNKVDAISKDQVKRMQTLRSLKLSKHFWRISLGIVKLALIDAKTVVQALLWAQMRLRLLVLIVQPLTLFKLRT